MDFVDHTTYPLADNFYGWAKIGYENLGFIFATGRFGRPVENIHLRIVVPRPVDGAALAGNQVSYKRGLAGYLSVLEAQRQAFLARSQLLEVEPVFQENLQPGVVLDSAYPVFEPGPAIRPEWRSLPPPAIRPAGPVPAPPRRSRDFPPSP